MSWNAMTRALETYRHSLDVYRQVIESYAELARRNRAPNGAVDEPVKYTNGHAVVRTPGIVVLPSLEGLTPREQQVARLMAQGYTNQQIANRLVVTRGTAANHVAHILAKLGLTNRTQVAAHVVAASSDGQNHVPHEAVVGR